MFDRSKNVRRPTKHHGLALGPHPFDVRDRPEREDLLRLRPLAEGVSSVHVAVDPFQLGRLLQFDPEVLHTPQQCAEPDRVGGVPVQIELIDQIRLEPLEVRTDGRYQPEHQLGARIPQQPLGLEKHDLLTLA
jgi:hypothetical protein